MDTANVIQLMFGLLALSNIVFLRCWQYNRSKAKMFQDQLSCLCVDKPTILDGQKWHEHLDNEGRPFMYIRKDCDVLEEK